MKTIKSSRNIFLHSLMSKTILLVIFGIITGLKICWYSNISRISTEWRNHIKSLDTIFQPMLNKCRKSEDVKFNIFEDMTLSSLCIFLGTPGICTDQYCLNISIWNNISITLVYTLSCIYISLILFSQILLDFMN